MKEKERTEKIFEEMMAETFSKSDENYKLTDLGSSMNPKHNKNEKTYTKTHHSQIFQN